MASFWEGVYSLYVYHKRLVCFKRKSLCLILMNSWNQFAKKFFDTSINISFKFYCAE